MNGWRACSHGVHMIHWLVNIPLHLPSFEEEPLLTHPTAGTSNISLQRVATVIVGWFAGCACKNVISVTPNCPNDRVLCIVYIQLKNVATSWKTWPTAQRSTLKVTARYMVVFVCKSQISHNYTEVFLEQTIVSGL